MARRITLAGLLLAAAFVGGCDYGRKLEFGKLEVYYTGNVTEDQARKLGEFLSRAKSDKPRSVQLDRKGGAYLLRMVVVDDYRDLFGSSSRNYRADFRILAAFVSKNILDGNPVEIHLTNKHFETREVIAIPPQTSKP